VSDHDGLVLLSRPSRSGGDEPGFEIIGGLTFRTQDLVDFVRMKFRSTLKPGQVLLFMYYSVYSHLSRCARRLSFFWLALFLVEHASTYCFWKLQIDITLCPTTALCHC